mgnify:CR=1 FL=1
MDIEKFKHQHRQIYAGIDELRRLAHAGIAAHADRIAQSVVAMSSLIKVHLAIEDKLLYPALRDSRNPALANMGQDYQQEMKSIAAAYESFSRRWNTAHNVAADPEGFRRDANTVLKTLHERVRREDKQLYPAVESH